MSTGLTLRTAICDLLSIEYPIFLAGMGVVARPDLVAAVSNAGGLGILGARRENGRLVEPEQWRAEIRKVRQMTDKPFGADLIIPGGIPPTANEIAKEIPKEHRALIRQLKAELGIPEPIEDDLDGPAYNVEYAKAMVHVVCEEKLPVFASGLGLPDWVVPVCREAGVKVISLVGNVKNARRVAALEPDIIVAQGYDAGGHTGRIGTFSLVPQVVDAVRPTPVLAAGGVGDGRALAAALALGAAGVWCGTRFIPTIESPVHPNWKHKILEMTEEDTRITKSYSGKTLRALRNKWSEAWDKAGVPALPFPYQGVLAADVVCIGARTGDTDYALMPTGQVGGLIKEIRPAGDVLREMVAQAVDIVHNKLLALAP